MRSSTNSDALSEKSWPDTGAYSSSYRRPVISSEMALSPSFSQMSSVLPPRASTCWLKEIMCWNSCTKVGGTRRRTDEIG
jgi:hypothetical protein